MEEKRKSMVQQDRKDTGFEHSFELANYTLEAKIDYQMIFHILN